MAVTTAAIASVVIAGTSAGMSFGQARQQRKLGEEAKRDAQKAMAEARKALDVNAYDQLAVQKEPYELQREALLAQGALATQAGVEGDRGAAATAGRVQAAMNTAQGDVRTGMGKELSDLAMLSAQEDARNRDIGIQLNLEDVAGAQAAAADAAVARSQAIQQGMQSAGSAVQGAIDLVPLYQQNLGAQKAALSKMEFTPEQFASFEKLGANPRTDGFSSLDFQQLGGMNNSQFRQFKQELTPDQGRLLFQNEQYLNNYNPNFFKID
jgi:hypothetical protein